MHHPLHRSDRNTHSPFRPILARSAAAAALLLGLAAPDATAALSRWSASSNRIYVEEGGSMTLTDIRASTPNLPDAALQRIDAAANIWLLTANIVVEDGSRLNLSGDVKELRLQSNPSSAPDTDVTSFVSITADYGEIHINGVKITSWDTAANAPDTNVADGRAFIRARSSADALTGLPNVSRMDVLNSDVGYLGYNDSERYGLSWKANGDLTVLDVLGNVLSSHIHHNYYGIYTFGLQGDLQNSGVWRGNEVDHNVGYGFDAHDDSDRLLIENNNVHDNGNHGIILSERCDSAQIVNNVSNANAGNGIMLHDLSDDAIVEGNTASQNADAGVALFCSKRAQVRNNILSNNTLYGVRLSVAAADNVLEANRLEGSGAYGIFMYKGTDTKGVCGGDLIPRGNTFTGNTIAGSGINGLKISEGTANTFAGNTFNDGASIKNALSSEEWTVDFRENTFGQGVVVDLDGSATTPLHANFADQPAVTVGMDTGALARFTDDGGAIFDLTRDVMVAVNGSASQLDLTADTAGAPKVEVLTRPLFVTTDGTRVEVAPTLWETGGAYGKAWIARAANPAGSVQYRVGDLQPGVSYEARRGDTALGTFAADSGGEITFADVPGDTATLTYTIVRSADQPQGGGDGGGGGAPGALLLALLGAAGLGRRAGRQFSWWWRRTA